MTSSDADLAIDLIVACARVTRLVRRGATAESPATWRALSILDELGPLRVTEFADADRLTQPSATSILQRLHAEGATTSAPDPDDGRATVVTLSPQGRERLSRLRQDAATMLAGQLDALDPRERATLAEASNLLSRLVTDTPPQHPTRRTSS